MHERPSSTVNPEVALEPAPAVADCVQGPATSLTAVGSEPRASEAVTVTESCALPARDVPGVKATAKFVEMPSGRVPGVATTLLTAVPIV